MTLNDLKLILLPSFLVSTNTLCWEDSKIHEYHLKPNIQQELQNQI